MAALACGLDVFAALEHSGGMAALRAKSVAMTDLFVRLIEQRCAGHGLSIVTPRDPARRGSQVGLTRATGAHAIVQALIARGLIGDFRAGQADAAARAPDIMRFGFAPLYLRFSDVWHAVEQLRQVLDAKEWQQARFQQTKPVT
jgi:kynureninase